MRATVTARNIRTSLFVGLLAATVGATDWRVMPFEVANMPAWMVEAANRPVDTNEIVVADAPRDMKLFLLIGQSNMAGRGKIGAEDAGSISRCLTLNRDGKWIHTTTPIHFDRKNAGYGIANTFVRRYLDEHTTDTVGLVPCAVGGSRSMTWSPENAPDPVGTNFRRALARARLAQANGRFVGILWHQGEADVGFLKRDPAHRDRYVSRLAALAAALREGLGCADVPFLVGEIGTLPRDCTAMNPVLAAAAAAIPNGHLVKAADLTGHLADGVHFDTPSYRILGARYYEAWKSAYGALLRD